MNDTGPLGVHTPAAIPARIGVVDVALQGLCVEVHRQGDAQRDPFAAYQRQ
jgi:hypothetical protein